MELLIPICLIIAYFVSTKISPAPPPSRGNPKKIYKEDALSSRISRILGALK